VPDVSDFVIRPMRPEDIPGVEAVTSDGFYDHEVRTLRADWPEPTRRSPARVELWSRRALHMLETDPGGCFVADIGGEVVGAVISLRRELTWVLSTYAVRPGLQGRGVGRQLMLAALEHGRGCLRGLISASDDQAAVRSYHQAGFTLHPMMFLRGPVPREVLPVVERVREGSASDIELMDSVDRRVRDAAHGPDHEFLLTHLRLVVVDRSTGSGYAYVEQGGGAALLAATNRRTATDLLWECLAAAPDGEQAGVGHLTAANPWAIDIGMACRMQLHTSGYLAVRGMKPPAPYIHHGVFL
jgi:ribosomal protein S18 acetylase RimI-like enzyme